MLLTQQKNRQHGSPLIGHQVSQFICQMTSQFSRPEENTAIRRCCKQGPLLLTSVQERSIFLGLSMREAMTVQRDRYRSSLQIFVFSQIWFLALVSKNLICE